jgi:streptomycin 3"-adenylyltransferase
VTALSPADTEQLDRVLDVVRDVVREELVGAYLFGSATAGGLKATSDLDVFVVVSEPLARAAKERLAHELLPISGRDGRRHVEVTVVAHPEVRPWRFPPVMDFQYGDWLRDEIERGDGAVYAARPNPDLAALITLVQRRGTTLVGPQPDAVFDPIPWDDFVRGTSGQVDELLPGIDDRTDLRNGVLTLARIWASLVTGEVLPKDVAADWAIERLPDEHRPVLARARAIYVGEEESHWDDLDDRVRPHVEHLLATIDRVAAQPRSSPQ